MQKTIYPTAHARKPATAYFVTAQFSQNTVFTFANSACYGILQEIFDLKMTSCSEPNGGSRRQKRLQKWSKMKPSWVDIGVGNPMWPRCAKVLKCDEYCPPPPGPQKSIFFLLFGHFFTALFHLFFLHFWSPFLGTFRHHFLSILEQFFIPCSHVAKRADPSKTLPLPAK